MLEAERLEAATPPVPAETVGGRGGMEDRREAVYGAWGLIRCEWERGPRMTSGLGACAWGWSLGIHAGNMAG